MIRGITNIGEAESVQEDLNNVCDWCEEWLMPPNQTKCKVLHAGINNPKHVYHITIKDKTTELGTSVLERDLGINIDQALSFDQHVDHVTAKCNRILGLIKRTITSRSPDVIKKLYTVLVRPHLEYCGSALILKKKQQRKKLEGVQRRATKMVSCLKHMQYEERLQSMKLPSLHYRRKRGDAIQVFKYLNGLSMGSTDTLLPKDGSRRTRGHGHKLLKKRCRTEVRRYSFSQRVVNPWNGLSAHAVEARTLNAFKHRLDGEWAAEVFVCE